MYFKPSDIVHFKIPSLFSKILFFASLYIAMLSNEILIKMGRGHDKRVYYIESGLDANYEQAIMSVIHDVKTKEFKLDSISDISTISNLNPGRFDDLFIPMSNGERAMDIDTLAGMDSELNNEFLEFLLNSVISGMGVPTSVIDARNSDTDFARTLSAQNGNFIREVIKIQKRLTPQFEQLFRMLYANEYYYDSEGNKTDSDTYIDSILVRFPSPATLAQTNLIERADNAERLAEQYARALVPNTDSSDDEKVFNIVKASIFKEQMPGVKWKDMEKYVIAARKNLLETKEILKKEGSDEEDDYGGY